MENLPLCAIYATTTNILFCQINCHIRNAIFVRNRARKCYTFKHYTYAPVKVQNGKNVLCFHVKKDELWQHNMPCTVKHFD